MYANNGGYSRYEDHVRRGICVITYLKKQSAFGCRKHNIGPVNRRMRIIKFIKR